MNNRIHLFVFLISFLSANIHAESIDLKHKNSLTVVEINSGDQINYRLENGRLVKIKLIKTDTRVVFTTLEDTKKGSDSDATIYSMESELEIDGHRIRMIRYVPVQQSFYEPYIVNGLMIWFDGLNSLDNFFNENHGNCLPKKEARFALQDACFSICPVEMTNWVTLPNRKVIVKDAYRGDDTWLGTYFGADLHGGLDINMPNNTALYAPIDFDQHYYFNSLRAGSNNNRWRGTKMWENGDIWYLQTHHLNQLLIPEYQPIKQGQKYAYTAGTHAGYSPHTHFVFKVKQPGFEEYSMDPWLIFWQIIHNNMEKSHAIKAHFSPLSPEKTGNPLYFNSDKSRAGVWGNELKYFWDFGDGQSSLLPDPIHIYTSPGIYPVTLIVNDEQDEIAYRQFITIDGPEIENGSFKVSIENEPSFRESSKWKTLMHNNVIQPKNTILFNVFLSRNNLEEKISPKIITIHKKKIEWIEKPARNYRIESICRHGIEDWLNIKSISCGDSLKLEISPDLDKIKLLKGSYEGYIVLHHENSTNSPLMIRTVVKLEESNTDSIVIIDDSSPNCISSDYFWLKPEFHNDWANGYQGNFIINRDNSSGEFVRFILNVSGGIYTVSLYGTPYLNSMLMEKTGGFHIIIKHKNGIDRKWIEPLKSLEIGSYEFDSDNDNFIEIITDNSEGLILIDSIKLKQNKMIVSSN